MGALVLAGCFVKTQETLEFSHPVLSGASHLLCFPLTCIVACIWGRRRATPRRAQTGRPSGIQSIPELTVRRRVHSMRARGRAVEICFYPDFIKTDGRDWKTLKSQSTVILFDEAISRVCAACCFHLIRLPLSLLVSVCVCVRVLGVKTIRWCSQYCLECVCFGGMGRN